MTPPEEGFHSASPTQHDTRVHFTDYLNPYFSVCDCLWGGKSASESGCFCKLNNLILGRKI